MGRIVIVVYRAKPNKDAELTQLLLEHVPILRSQGLATEREPIFMRSKEGAFVEVFEWVSDDAIAQAHVNPEVGKLWARFDAALTFDTLTNLAESKDWFATFTSM